MWWSMILSRDLFWNCNSCFYLVLVMTSTFRWNGIIIWTRHRFAPKCILTNQSVEIALCLSRRHQYRPLCHIIRIHIPNIYTVFYFVALWMLIGDIIVSYCFIFAAIKMLVCNYARETVTVCVSHASNFWWRY